MIQYRWYVGYKQQDGKPVGGLMESAVIDYLMGIFKGVTMYPSAGLWREDVSPLTLSGHPQQDGDPNVHREQTIVLEVVTEVSVSMPSPLQVAKVLAELTNQKTVMYTAVSLEEGGYV